MSSEPSDGTSGGGIVGAIGFTCVILKLCGVVDWSWWWVTAPFWGSPVVFVAAMVVAVLFGGRGRCD